jgi:hypothetical protein
LKRLKTATASREPGDAACGMETSSDLQAEYGTGVDVVKFILPEQFSQPIAFVVDLYTLYTR